MPNEEAPINILQQMSWFEKVLDNILSIAGLGIGIISLYFLFHKKDIRTVIALFAGFGLTASVLLTQFFNLPYYVFGLLVWATFVGIGGIIYSQITKEEITWEKMKTKAKISWWIPKVDAWAMGGVLVILSFFLFQIGLKLWSILIAILGIVLIAVGFFFWKKEKQVWKSQREIKV